MKHQLLIAAVLAVTSGYYRNSLPPTRGHRHPSVPRITLAAASGDVAKVRALIEKGADVNELDWLGQSALHMTSKFQQFETSKELLQNGANCCIANDEYGETPLHLAAKTGALDIIELLIAKGAKINNNIVDFTPGGTPLCYAALYLPNSFQTAKTLLAAGADPSIKNAQGETVLQLYADAGNLRVVSMLIEQYRIDVNQKNEAGCTALYHLATSHYDSHKWPTFAYLLNSRANTAAACWQSRKTPLHAAAMTGNKLYVELLLKYNASVDSLDAFGRTPLYMAVVFADRIRPEVIQLLLNAKANPNLKANVSNANKPCDSILSHLLRRIRILESESHDPIDRSLIDVMLKHGARVDDFCTEDVDMLEKRRQKWKDGSYWKSANKSSAADSLSSVAEIVTASMGGDYDAVGSLISSNALSNSSDPIDGKTALHWAVAGEYVYITGMLLSGGFEANAQDFGGQRPLHLAASTGNTKVMELLLWKGAKVDYSDYGVSPLKFAIEQANSPAAVELLLKYGAKVNAEHVDPPLLHLAATNQNIRIMHLLIDAGARINAKSEAENGRTAFAQLVQSDCCYPQIPVLADMLSKGANINSKDNDGRTALTIAIFAKKRKEIILFLIDNGADVNVVDNRGCNAPLYLLIKKVNTLTTRYYRHAMISEKEEDEVSEIVRQLLAAGADRSAVDGCENRTALQLARDKGLNEKVVKLLKN